MTVNEKALMMHEQWNGKLEITSKAPVKSPQRAQMPCGYR